MTTTENTETNTWQLPIEEMMQKHRDRIAGNEDMVPALVEAWHIGEPMPSWTVWIHQTNDEIGPRDAGLHAATIMASTTGCDYIMFSYDTHVTSLRNNPKTGEPWKRGEMQAMCDEEGFCETGQMTDNLVMTLVDRAGHLYFAGIPYHFHKGEVMFYEEKPPLDELTTDGTEMSGIIPDGLREAMSGPTLWDMLKKQSPKGKSVPEILGFKPEEAGLVRLHQILAGVRILNEAAKNSNLPRMYMSMVPTRSDEEVEIVKHSAERSGLDILSSDDLAHLADDTDDSD